MRFCYFTHCCSVRRQQGGTYTFSLTLPPILFLVLEGFLKTTTSGPALVKIDGNLEGGIGLYRVQHYRVINNGYNYKWEVTGTYGIRIRALFQREYQREVEVTT
jgi:hypothetical protein